MRILVVGAGALGGYFGGRLLQAGRDVTFLVRPGRAAVLARDGLVIRSSYGDATLAAPTVVARDLNSFFDLVLLSCKAYDLEQAIADIAPAIGPDSTILPVLNGMRHLDVLDARFGAERVLGGLSVIGATLDPAGAVLHLNDMHGLTFGERSGGLSDRVRKIAAAMEGAVFNARATETILQEMWEKWVFLASLAGITCLMRAPIGDIAAAPGGAESTLGMLDACRAVAETAGYPPRPAFLERTRGALTQAGSPMTASMLRDVERGAATEADHVIGDLIARAGRETDVGLLRVAYAHLKAYEARRARQLAADAAAAA